MIPVNCISLARWHHLFHKLRLDSNHINPIINVEIWCLHQLCQCHYRSNSHSKFSWTATIMKQSLTTSPPPWNPSQSVVTPVSVDLINKAQIDAVCEMKLPERGWDSASQVSQSVNTVDDMFSFSHCSIKKWCCAPVLLGSVAWVSRVSRSSHVDQTSLNSFYFAWTRFNRGSILAYPRGVMGQLRVELCQRCMYLATVQQISWSPFTFHSDNTQRDEKINTNIENEQWAGSNLTNCLFRLACFPEERWKVSPGFLPPIRRRKKNCQQLRPPNRFFYCWEKRKMGSRMASPLGRPWVQGQHLLACGWFSSYHCDFRAMLGPTRVPLRYVASWVTPRPVRGMPLPFSGSLSPWMGVPAWTIECPLFFPNKACHIPCLFYSRWVCWAF